MFQTRSADTFSNTDSKCLKWGIHASVFESTEKHIVFEMEQLFCNLNVEVAVRGNMIVDQTNVVYFVDPRLPASPSFFLFAVFYIDIFNKERR